MSLEHAPQRKKGYRPEYSDWGQAQISQLPDDIPRVLRVPETCFVTGLSAQQIWALEQQGRFPRRFKLSPDAPKNGACGHDYHEVMAWLKARRESREKASA